MLIGAISSAGIPGFAGFFSKDSIIEAVHLSKLPGGGFAYFSVLACVIVTAFYTFRMMFMAFHGKERFHDDRGGHHDVHGHGTGDNNAHGHVPHESPAVVTVPLILLAIPSVCAGWVIGPVLFGDYFGGAIVVAPEHDVLGELAKDFHGVLGMMAHALTTAPFWLAAGGIAAAAYLYLRRPDLAGVVKEKAGVLYTVLDRKYWFDELYSWLFAGGARSVGTGLWKGGDVAVIDGVFVNGSARVVGWFAGVIRRVQSGMIYHYAFTMIIGIVVLLTIIVAARLLTAFSGA
jgi:NADH-quinone oxidoreductase subunit L